MIRRPELDYDKIKPLDKERQPLNYDVIEQVNINIKYSGYISRQKKQVENFKKIENKKIPEGFDYTKVNSLRKEAVQKLEFYRPINIGQASRISGFHRQIYQYCLFIWNNIKIIKTICNKK